MTDSNATHKNEYDVVVCGGGFAGQTLARQLKLHHPDISVLMLGSARVLTDE